MSPRRTFQNCGISSSWLAFSHRPTRVYSASVRATSSAPRNGPRRLSASGFSVLNLNIVKMRPPRPTRSPPYSTGRPLEARIASAISSASGSEPSKKTAANTTSSARSTPSRRRLGESRASPR